MKEILNTPENVLEDQGICWKNCKSMLNPLTWQTVTLIRYNNPGVAAFRLANGYGALKDALDSDVVRFQRLARFGGPRGGAPGEFGGVKVGIFIFQGSQRRSRFLPRTCYNLQGFCYFGSQELIDKMDILGSSTNPSERKNL
ncbi:hypothetical protein MKW92_007151 [Papaver armeniacum]|nr:hypothetical protein MKW92_007151 [Papaver armeniacum]